MASKSEASILPQVSLTLLSVTLTLFLFWQLSLTRDLKSNLEAANEARSIQIEESNQTQTKTSAQLEAFLNDLLELAETDPQAAALVQRYNIRRNANASDSAGAQTGTE